MKNSRLVIDACHFTPNYNYCLLEALARKDERIVYATTKFAHGDVPDPPGVKILCCFFFLARIAGKFTSSGPTRRLLRAVEYPFNLFFLLIYVLVMRTKVIHFMWVVSPGLDYLIIRLLQLLGRKVIYTAHNPFPHEQKVSDRHKYSRIYGTVDHVIVLTNYTKQEIMTTFAIDAEQISVIPHGDYESLFSQYGCNDELAKQVRTKASGRRIISFLGGIRPYKGLDHFIEAFRLIKQKMPDSFFLVAGSVLIGSKPGLEQKLSNSCQESDIWFDLRFLPVADLKAYLSATDVLVQPYVSASQSGNTVMAYVAGIPVISSHVGGLAEMTADGETGYVVEPANALAIADAVVKCFQGDRYERMSHKARQIAAERYNWDTLAEQTATVYSHFDNSTEYK